MSKLSIITINYNNLEGLKKTFTSVFDQTYQDFEYIIIDGGSKDGSKELIRQHADKLTYWVSEPDKGIYNAMNKGIKFANSEYLLFLNSGDILLDCEVIKKSFSELHSNELIYGDILVNNGIEFNLKSYPKNLNFLFFLKDSLPHPATFIKRELFFIHETYNEEMKICSDWAFFLNSICKYNVSYRKIDQTISIFDYSGISSMQTSALRMNLEKEQFLNKHYYRFYQDLNSIIKDAAKLNNLRNSRLLKYLSIVFPQFKL